MGDVRGEDVPVRTARRVGIRALMVVCGGPMALGEVGEMGEVAGGILTDRLAEIGPRGGLGVVTCSFLHLHSLLSMFPIELLVGCFIRCLADSWLQETFSFSRAPEKTIC